MRLIAFIAAFDQIKASEELSSPNVQIRWTEIRVVSVEWRALVVEAGANGRSRPGDSGGLCDGGGSYGFADCCCDGLWCISI